MALPDTVIIADDLTGALDTGVVFAAAGHLVHVAVRAGSLDKALEGDPDILVVNSATRECPPAGAARMVAGICARLAGMKFERLFKKIDSRMRGNIATELAALRRLGITRAIVAPAIPEFGRFSADGDLYGTGLPEPVNMAQRLEGCGLNLEFPHISGQPDFGTIPARPPADTALVGARSLAAALAGPPRAGANTLLPAPLLAAIGSRDPVSAAQIAHLKAAAPAGAAILTAPDGDLGDPVPISPKVLLHMSAGAGIPLAPAVASERFAATVSALCATHEPATLFLCGGETALATLDLLEIDVLKPLAELFPGVPISRARHGDRDLTLVTKSGGFGQPDLLHSLFGSVVQDKAFKAD